MDKAFKEVALTANRPLQPADAAVEDMSRVVCALLVRGLNPPIVSNDFWKLSIRLNSNEGVLAGKVLLGVLIENRDFPISDFVTWNLRDRQAFMLRFVADTMRDVFHRRGLPIAQLDLAQSYVEQQSFANLIVGKKRFKHPGAITSRIECEQEMDEARVFVVMEGQTSPERVLVATTSPDEFIFQAFFGVVEWDGVSKPVLRKIDGTSVPIDAPNMLWNS